MNIFSPLSSETIVTAITCDAPPCAQPEAIEADLSARADALIDEFESSKVRLLYDVDRQQLMTSCEVYDPPTMTTEEIQNRLASAFEDEDLAEAVFLELERRGWIHLVRRSKG